MIKLFVKWFTFDIPTAINVFSGAPKPTDRRSTQKYGVFPVSGFRVGFPDVGRNLA